MINRSLKSKYRRLYTAFIVLVTTLLSNTLMAQSQFDVYKTLTSYKSGIALDRSVDSLLTLCEKAQDRTAIIKIARDYALSIAFKDAHKALYYTQIALGAFEYSETVNEAYTHTLYIEGRFHLYNEEYAEAISSHKKVIAINFNKKLTGKSYAELGRCYVKIGDFFRSISNFENGIKMLEEDNEYKLVAQHYINLSLPYRKINSPESMERRLQILQKADSLDQLYDIGFEKRKFLINAFANQYISKLTYDFGIALTYYNENLHTALERKDSATIAWTYNNLSNLYNLEKLDSALFFAKKGLKYVKGRAVKANLFDNMAQYYLINGQFHSALKQIHIALEVNLGETFQIQDVPNKYQLNRSTMKKGVLECLKKKTEVLIKSYQSGNDKALLEKAIANSFAADELISILQNSSSEMDSKLLWRKEASDSYFFGAYAAQLLNDHENSFSFMEKNKAFLLAESIHSNTSFSKLPRNVANREEDLRKKILALQGKLSELQNSNSEWLENILFNTKELHQNFLDSIKSIYREHFEHKVQINHLSLSYCKSTLKENEILFSIIQGEIDQDKQLIIGTLTNGTITKTYQIIYDASFSLLLREYKKFISKPFSSKTDQKDFQRVAFSLYNRIFPSADIKSMLHNKHLIIIPDGELQNLPFEALITNEDTSEYLIQSSNISYLYSMSFLNYNGKLERASNGRFIGYSPIYFTGKGLPDLKHTGKEIEAAEYLLEGEIILKKEASKKHFLRYSQPYKIIHLATHALTDDNPSIIFYDDALTQKELYNYKCNADLVTLSACKTSLGKVAKGEGVLSLTRGFFYAGAKAVISSLWNANDQSTEFIMTHFYTKIKEHQNKSEALSSAKRDYLLSHTLSERSPYYWSSFILTGDTQAISF